MYLLDIWLWGVYPAVRETLYLDRMLLLKSVEAQNNHFLIFFLSFLDPQWINLIWSLLQIAIVTICLILTVVFLVYFERKVIGYMHARVGPNRVGPKGTLQSIADTIKLLLK